MTLKVYTWILTLLFSLTSQVFAATSTHSGYFHGVLFKGEIANVRLHASRGLSYVVAHGASDDLANLTMIENADKLHMIMQRGYPKQGPVTIDVYIKDYRGITRRGNIPVSGQGIYSSGLVLSANGDANIDLSGHINIANIHAKGLAHIEINGVNSKRSKIELFGKTYVKLTGIVGVCELNIHQQSCLIMHWVNANTLKFVLGDNAYVQLAGHVNLLDVELFDKSKLAARFLRADRTFIKAHDDTVAEISSVRAQHTYALDRSHIDYFNVPLFKTDMMVENGSVLDMREWYLPFAQENRYFEE